MKNPHWNSSGKKDCSHVTVWMTLIVIACKKFVSRFLIFRGDVLTQGFYARCFASIGSKMMWLFGKKAQLKTFMAIVCLSNMLRCSLQHSMFSKTNNTYRQLSHIFERAFWKKSANKESYMERNAQKRGERILNNMVFRTFAIHKSHKKPLENAVVEVYTLYLEAQCVWWYYVY